MHWETRRHGENFHVSHCCLLSRADYQSLFAPYLRPIQGLIKNFRPEIEERIAQYNAKNGNVLFGGKLASELDNRFAIPDNLGADANRRIAAIGA